MAKLSFSKNTLPLLAITALFLSVALVNYDQSLVSNKSTQSVLSDSDEGEEREDRVEKRELKNEAKNLKTRTETIRVEKELEIEEDFDQDEVEEEIETENRFKLKMKSKSAAGKTVIETASGEVEVEQNPDEAINDIVETGLIDDPVSFEAKVNNREKVEFEIQGTDSKKFLGIFKVVIPKTITISSETGEVVSTNQNVWSRILSFLSN